MPAPPRVEPPRVEPPRVEPAAIARFRALLRPLRRYHQHRVVGLEHLPAAGGFLLALNHSMATYDAFMLGLAIHEATGRLPTGLGDNLIFKLPGLADAARRAGIRPASPAHGIELLRQGEVVMVAPGGMREALRPSSERYTVRWERRRGFVRLALLAQVPIVLVGCRAADDMFTVYENRLTKLVYRRWRLPLPIVRGLGPSLVPRPVRLVHRIAPPVVPPVLDVAATDAQVDALHARVSDVMRGLLRG